MAENDSMNTFSDSELAFGEERPVLGPDYERAQRVAERAMASFQEAHFKPMLDQFAKEFRDKLWGDICDWLIGDTKMNLQNEIRHVAEATVFALLHGHRGYAKRYVLDDSYQSRKVREAIFEQFKDQIVAKGIEERDAEIERLKESLRFRP